MTPKIEKEEITAPTAVKNGPPRGKFKEKHQHHDCTIQFPASRLYYTVPSITTVLYSSQHHDRTIQFPAS
jgi:hypothetical protein